MKVTTKRERNLRVQGFRAIAGMDEVGRGSWAGPLVAAAVILKDRIRLPGLNDSKLLSHEQRQRLFPLILRQCVAWGMGMVSAAEIDAEGLAAAQRTVFERTLSAIHHPIDYLLIDGRGFRFVVPFECIVDGDAKVASIAAASIVAKVYRDHLMRFCDQLFPDYAFGRHKGYGTPDHQHALKRHGPSIIHRKSYEPVAALTI